MVSWLDHPTLLTQCLPQNLQARNLQVLQGASHFPMPRYVIFPFSEISYSLSPFPVSFSPFHQETNLLLSAHPATAFLPSLPVASSTQEKYGPVQAGAPIGMVGKLQGLEGAPQSPLYSSSQIIFSFLSSSTYLITFLCLLFSFPTTHQPIFSLLPTFTCLFIYFINIPPFYTKGPKKAFKILLTSILSSQQCYEIGWAETVSLARGYPVSFNGGAEIQSGSPKS